MKLNKVLIVLGYVCILSTMAAGCGSGFEASAKIEENQTGEALPEERNS